MSAGLPVRIHGPDEVDVGYEPWEAVLEVALRVGPDASAPVVLADDGRRCVLQPGDHLGRQSTRNPRCLTRPPLRASVNGHVWGYLIRRGYPAKSGWMRLAALRRALEYNPRVCGPAGADFDRRRPDACASKCDGRAIVNPPRRSGTAIVQAREAYLRWSPRGTAFRYVVTGDTVRRLAQWEDFTAIEITEARWAPTAGRGWVSSSALQSF